MSSFKKAGTQAGDESPDEDHQQNSMGQLARLLGIGRSTIRLSILCASEDANVAAYSSASAPLLAMICGFLVYAFGRCLPSIATAALDHVLVSLSPAQSATENTVTSELRFPNSNT